MPDIIAGENFETGQQVTASRLNNHVNGATILPGAIFNKIQGGAGGVPPYDPGFADSKINTSDFVLVYDVSAQSLIKATVGDLFENTISGTIASPTWGSPGIGYTISPEFIAPKRSLTISRDSSDDLVAYTPRNWLTIGDASYQNQNVKPYANSAAADVAVKNTVDFFSNTNFYGDVGLSGMYVNNGGFQMFAPSTFVQLPKWSDPTAISLFHYKNKATEAGLPGAAGLATEDMAGIIGYSQGSNQVVFHDNTGWETVATRSYVSQVVTDIASGPAIKAMVVFDGGPRTILKSYKVTQVVGGGPGSVHRIIFEEPMQDTAYAVSVDCSYDIVSWAGGNAVRGSHSTYRGLTYLEVYGSHKIWSKSGGTNGDGIWTIIVWEIPQDIDAPDNPDDI